MKKLISILLVAVLLLPIVLMTACGKEKIDDSDSTLEIYVYKAGYGDEFLNELEKRFEAANPGKDVVIWGDSADSYDMQLKAGPQGNSVDLFITGGNYNNYVFQGSEVLKGYDVIMEPIDRVLEAEENGVKVIDKFLSGFKPEKINGHYYSFNWATGLTGLVYNKTIFDQLGLKEPKTTDELIALTESIRNLGKIPFVFSTSTNYWEYLRNIWYAQYQSLQGVNNFFNGIDGDVYSRDIFYQKGREESLKVLSDLINHPNGNNHDLVNSMNFTRAQAQFILGNGLMTVNGDWLENEMKSVEEEDLNKYEMRMMRSPIISSVIDQCTLLKTDADLVKMIDYIDRTIDLEALKSYLRPLSSLSEEEFLSNLEKDIARITEARSVSHSIGFNHSIGIPVYSTAKELAKDFLIYMTTDEAQQIYFDTTMGNQLPFKYDFKNDEARWNKMSEFAKSRYEIMTNAQYFTKYTNTPLFAHGLVQYSGSRNFTEIFFTSKDAKDRKTPKQILDEEYENWTVEKWNLLLRSAGVR